MPWLISLVCVEVLLTSGVSASSIGDVKHLELTVNVTVINPTERAGLIRCYTCQRCQPTRRQCAPPPTERRDARRRNCPLVNNRCTTGPALRRFIVAPSIS
ncbi:hypothetical protein J6590_106027 [Homalodisca vitripennis]|nr:hypothetical protein J6590_106027 [Homalodisca vitripennis]